MSRFVVQLLLAAAVLHVCWSHRVERIGGNVRFALGEGPHWDEQTDMLYFVDIHNAAVVRYNHYTNRFHRAKVPGFNNVGFIIPVAGFQGLYVVGADLSVLLIQWDGYAGVVRIIKELTRLTNRVPTNRFNDGKADFQGRLVAGTMSEKEVVKNTELLISLNADLRQQILIDNSGLSNGIAWDRARGKMYHCDSDNETVTQYDYDERTGRIANREVLFVVTDPIHGFPKDALPDGLNIDTQGNLYIAIFGGSAIVQFDPINRVVLQKIPIPARQVTSTSWGGRYLDTLFVTTADQPNDDGEPNNDPNGGALYVVRGLNRRGFRGNRFVINPYLIRNCNA